MRNNPHRRIVRLQAKCVALGGTRDVRPLPNYTDYFYAGVKVCSDVMQAEGIRRDDIAIIAMGRAAKRGDLVAVETLFGYEVERFDPPCTCSMLGVVVRIERDILSAI